MQMMAAETNGLAYLPVKLTGLWPAADEKETGQREVPQASALNSIV